MDKETIKNISLTMGISKKEVRQMIKNEINKEVNFKYAEKLNDQKYLKPTKKITKRALKVLIEKYVNFVGKKEKEYDDIFYNYQKYYTYTEIKKGNIFKYQFIYSIDYNNRRKKGLIFEGNKFDFILSYDFKNRKGLWNEAYVFNFIAGYSYKMYYDNMIIPYYYPESIKKSKKEGGFKWNAVREHSEEYDNLKINEYFKLDNKQNEEHKAQRILELNPDHVEMLYKMGFKELYNQRISNQKMEFVKKNSKYLEKNITRKELAKVIRFVKQGLDIRKYKEISKFTERTVNLSDFRIKNIWLLGMEKLTTTQDLKKIKRMINLEKDFGKEHLRMLKGSCRVLGLDFEEMIFQSLKTRESIITEFQEIKRKEELETKERNRKEKEERNRKEKLAKITLEKFLFENDVIYEKIDEARIRVKRVNSTEIDKEIYIYQDNIALIYEEKKEADDFFEKNQITLEKKGRYTLIKTLNGEIIDEIVYEHDPVDIYKRCEEILLEKKIKLTSLEEITDKFKKIEKENFIIEPLKTMKDFADISEKMNLCLLRNEYQNKVKMKRSILYIVYPKNETEKYNGEVVEFGLKRNKIEVKQIHGKDNRNTPNYDQIRAIAENISYEEIMV